LIFVSWVFYAMGAFGVFVLRRKEPTAPRPYKVPVYPIVPWVFIVFATVYLAFTVYNDVLGYQAAVAAGKPAMIDSAFGTVLVVARFEILETSRHFAAFIPFELYRVRRLELLGTLELFIRFCGC